MVGHDTGCDLHQEVAGHREGAWAAPVPLDSDPDHDRSRYDPNPPTT